MYVEAYIVYMLDPNATNTVLLAFSKLALS